MSTERLLYLIAELSLQLDDEYQATKYFSKISENQHSASEPKIVNLAKERWQDFREEREQIYKSPIGQRPTGLLLILSIKTLDFLLNKYKSPQQASSVIRPLQRLH